MKSESGPGPKASISSRLSAAGLKAPPSKRISRPALLVDRLGFSAIARVVVKSGVVVQQESRFAGQTLE